MEEGFILPITYKGTESEFEVRLIANGYTHRFYVDIGGIGVFFERDEERNFRAVLDEKSLEKKPDLELVALLGKKIEELFKTA